jgi:hypothetical protein
LPDPQDRRVPCFFQSPRSKFGQIQKIEMPWSSHGSCLVTLFVSPLCEAVPIKKRIVCVATRGDHLVLCIEDLLVLRIFLGHENGANANVGQRMTRVV